MFEEPYLFLLIVDYLTHPQVCKCAGVSKKWLKFLNDHIRGFCHLKNQKKLEKIFRDGFLIFYQADVNTLKYLKARGIDDFSDGSNKFMEECSKGTDTEMMYFILQNIPEYTNTSDAMFQSIKRQNYTMFDLIFGKSKRMYQYTCFLILVEHGFVNQIQHMLKIGFKIQMNDHWNLIVRHNQILVAEFFKKSHPFPPQDSKLLYAALEYRMFKMARFLVENGIQFGNHASEWLLTFARRGNYPAMRFLISHQVAFPSNITPQKYVLCGSNIRILKIFESQNFKIDTQEVFLTACQSNQQRVISYLINHGANVQMDDNSALISAIECGNMDLVRFLLKKGANIRARCSFGILLSFNLTRHKMIEFLIENGACLYTCASTYCINTNHQHFQNLIQSKKKIQNSDKTVGEYVAWFLYCQFEKGCLPNQVKFQ